MAVTDSLLLAVGCLATVGYLLELGNVYWMTAIQEHVPTDLLGRVSAVDWLMSGSLIPVGMALVGAAAWSGAGPVFAAGGAATALTATAAAVALRARDPAVVAAR